MLQEGCAPDSKMCGGFFSSSSSLLTDLLFRERLPTVTEAVKEYLFCTLETKKKTVSTSSQG